MTKPFSVAFKQKMIQRLTGKDALSASQLARETGLRQQNLSRWLEEARSLPMMTDILKPAVREWTVEQKARVLAEGSKLDGEALTAYLERQGVKLFVDWYNGTHRHSAIRYVTPNQRHHRRERAILASRHQLYERARCVNPERWSGSTRNWLPIGLVVLNPERAPYQAAA